MSHASERSAAQRHETKKKQKKRNIEVIALQHEQF